jgi:hypothetical protein
MSDNINNPGSLADYGYTAFEKWDYHPFVFVQEQPKPWISFKESFYRASEFIIKNLALAASAMPARRASSTDPMLALRGE